MDKYVTADQAKMEEMLTEQEIANAASFDASHYRSNLTSMYIHEVKQYALLTDEQEKDLSRKKAAGDAKAREDMINSNLRLVVAMAKKKYDQLCAASVSGVNFDDLIQDGSLGLITAVDKYDVDKGVKFSTYAVYWINQAINHGLAETSRSVYIPEHKIGEIVIIRHLMSDFEATLHRNPSVEEMYLALNKRFTKKRLVSLINLSQNEGSVSLDTPIGDDQDGGVLEDIIPDNNKTPIEYAEEQERHENINKALNQLPEKERLVIKLAFGLGGAEPMILADISKVLYEHGYTNKQGGYITREGVRWIKEHGLKLMTPFLKH